ncbi:uncharacterized protein LOC119348173, partial [Triticum dicoccoides]|uniref:uncharacterized protein LOC119348173 n=1 Tax=Triticum dicoccoides TaxID=85692 RepID=UPI00188E71B4
MADTAKSTVDSLLGTLARVIGNEAELLGGVRRDMQFIKDEMESMNGFILDVADPTEQSNQVQAWMKQVRDVAYDSQNCVDRYVQTFGGGHGSSAGLLASIRRAPRKDVAAIARQAFGDTDPDNIVDATACLSRRSSDIGYMEFSVVISWIVQLLGLGRKANSEEDGDFLEEDREKEIKPEPTTVDEHFKKAKTPWDIIHAEKHYSRQLKTWLGKVFNNFIVKELVLGNAFLQAAVKLILGNAWVQKFLDVVGATAAAATISASIKNHAPAAVIDYIRRNESGIESEIAWLKDIVSDGRLSKDGRRPRLLAIVTPPVDVPYPEDEEEPHAYRPATKIARRVHDISLEAKNYDCVAWINARRYSGRKERLQLLLQQLLHPSSGDDQETSTWSDERLQRKIRRLLQGKKFLIVLADHEDVAPWEDIASALPRRGQYDDNSTVIVTPVIQQSVQFHGWYLASWLFLLSASRYKVHFYSHIEALSKKANELLVGGHESEELKSNVKRILEKCRWDSFSTGLFLHALYANPRRSNNELVALQHRLQDFNT